MSVIQALKSAMSRLVRGQDSNQKYGRDALAFIECNPPPALHFYRHFGKPGHRLHPTDREDAKVIARAVSLYYEGRPMVTEQCLKRYGLEPKDIAMTVAERVGLSAALNFLDQAPMTGIAGLFEQQMLQSNRIPETWSPRSDAGRQAVFSLAMESPLATPEFRKAMADLLCPPHPQGDVYLS